MLPKDILETNFNHIRGDPFITFSSTDYTWCKRILRLSQDPESNIRIKTQNEDGSIVAEIPKEYLRVRKPYKRNLSDEQRKALADRMRKIR